KRAFWSSTRFHSLAQQDVPTHAACAEKYRFWKTKVLAVFSRPESRSAIPFFTIAKRACGGDPKRRDLSSKNHGLRPNGKTGFIAPFQGIHPIMGIIDPGRCRWAGKSQPHGLKGKQGSINLKSE